MVAFQADGRPVLDPRYANDPVARRRLEESKLLLNLDHPDFNAQRERLLHEINEDVLTHEDLPVTSPQREATKARTSRRILPTAPFSMAARHYLLIHRHLDWVEHILNAD